MFAQQNTSAHAPSIALLEEGRTSPARPTETTPRLTTEMTVADPGALAGHPQPSSLTHMAQKVYKHKSVFRCKCSD